MPIFRKNRNSFRASVWPDRHIAKWGAGGAPPEGVFNPPAPCLQGSRGVLGSEARVLLVSDPLKVPRWLRAFRRTLRHTHHNVVPFSCFFSCFFRSTKNHKKHEFCAPRGHPKSNKNCFASLVVTLQKATPFQMLFFLFFKLSGTPRTLEIMLKRCTVSQKRRSHLLRTKT